MTNRHQGRPPRVNAKSFPTARTVDEGHLLLSLRHTRPNFGVEEKGLGPRFPSFFSGQALSFHLALDFDLKGLLQIGTNWDSRCCSANL